MENRAYFAASIPDRGDEYFREFDARLRLSLEEQKAGLHHYHVLVEPDGSIAGRINLVDVDSGSASLGYRIAELATGRGLATDAVNQVCEIAVADYGLVELRASATRDNAASLAVLARTGFVHVGDTTLNGRPALRFLRRLTSQTA